MSDPTCLHCAIHRTIAEHVLEHGRCDDATGARVLDVKEVAHAIGQVLGETLAGIPNRRMRGRVMAYVSEIAGAASARAEIAERWGDSDSLARCH